MEIWKDVKGYEDYYQVSSLGRIKRKSGYVNVGIKNNEKRLVKERILKQRLRNNGYLSVDLSKEHIVKTISVHRIVAMAFIENDSPLKTYVNHINCNKCDNRVENLEWVTPRENSHHAKENKLFKTPNKKQVRCKQLNKSFESSYAAAEYINNKYFNNSKQVIGIASKIRLCCNGKQKIAYGLNWEYCI